MERLFCIVFIFCLSTMTKASEEKQSLIAKLEDRLEARMGEASLVVMKWLEGFNDRHLAGSELGRLMQYEKIKPRLDDSSRSKKMSMAMMPIIFHIGATSTWMLLTAIMASKSVAIGLLLLVFKIAVSSAKLSSFFTLLKEKKHHHEWSPPPHYDHGHEYARSMPISEPAYVDSPSAFEEYAYPTPSHAQGYDPSPPSSYLPSNSHKNSPSSYIPTNSHSSSSSYIPTSSHSSSSSSSSYIPTSSHHSSTNSYSPSYSSSSSQPSSQSSFIPHSQEWMASEPSTVKNEQSGYYYR